MQTTGLAVAKEQAAQLVRASGGEVFQETTSFGQRGSISLTVNVPPDQFDTMLKQLGALGTPSKQEIRTEDVTQQLVDFDARIRSAQPCVTSVAALVEKSTNLIETAQPANGLQWRVAELESLRAQNQTLDRRVELATIVLTLETDTGTPAAEEAKVTPTTTARSVLPFAPAMIALALVVRWRTRRRFVRLEKGERTSGTPTRTALREG